MECCYIIKSLKIKNEKIFKNTIVKRKRIDFFSKPVSSPSQSTPRKRPQLAELVIFQFKYTAQYTVLVSWNISNRLIVNVYCISVKYSVAYI